MLTVQNTEAIRRIEDAIGYTFHDKRLLVQVLTRKTYLKIDPESPDNEVLEFYGDTLMNYHVTNYFMSKYAHMLDDGLFFMRTVEQFTDMRSHYVCNRYLTDRVKAMGLARYLRAQNRDAELRRDGEKAYADIFESLVGAIYLDSYQNDTLIRAFILRQLGIEPKRLPDDIEAFDYDSLTAPIPSLPEYRELSVHEEVEKEVMLPAVAEAEISMAAPAAEESPADIAPVEAEAAAEAVIPAASPVEPLAEATTAPAVLTPKQEALAALCEALGYELPTYGETPKNAPNARPVAACTLRYKDAKGKLVKISLNDSGKTLAEATEKAAAKMMKKLEKQVAEAARKAETPQEATPVVTTNEVPVEAEPVEAKSIETAPVEVTPVETAPVEAVAEEAAPALVLPATEATAPEQPAEEGHPAEEPAAVEADPVTESAPAEDATPMEEASPVAAVEPATEVPTEKPTKSDKEKKSPAKKGANKSKKADTPVEAEAAAATAEALPESSAPADTAAEATAEEVKPAKAKKAPVKKKASTKEDKPATESTTDSTAAEAPTDSQALSEEVKPVKKRAPAKKKSAPKADTPSEEIQSDNE